MGIIIRGKTTIGITLESETRNFLDRMDVAPNSQRIFLLNNLIKGLKTYNLWNYIDVLYLFASHNSQSSLLNLINSSYTAYLAKVSGGYSTFTTDRGYTCHTPFNWVASPFNPGDGGSYNHKITDCIAMAYMNNPASGVTDQIIFCTNGAPSNSSIWLNYESTDQYYYSLCYQNTVSENTGINDGTEFLWLRRNAINTYNAGRNISYNTITHTRLTLGDSPLRIAYSNGTTAVFMAGKAFSDSDLNNFQLLIRTYLTAIGAN